LGGLLRPLVEGLDHPAPGFLAIVDLAEIKHLALHHLAAGAALALDNAPVAVLLAVLEASIRAQIHGETNLRQTILLKRYLVSTTREFRNPVVETTRFSLPPNPKIRRLPAPVEKVGLASIVTIDAVLIDNFERSGHSMHILPEWSPRLMRPVGDPTGRPSTLDLLLSGMAAAGHGVAGSRSIWGSTKRKSGSGPHPWGLRSRRRNRFAGRPRRTRGQSRTCVSCALWLDNVSAASIAATLGRSPSSVHGKRRWLGLGVRDRKRLTERPVVECRATALPWTQSFDVSAIVARLFSARVGLLPVVPEIDPLVQFPVHVKWALGRDEEKDKRFSILGFAGLRAPAIAERMLIEFGVRLTESAVNNRISRR
jgi:hypothetical protein